MQCKNQHLLANRLIRNFKPTFRCTKIAKMCVCVCLKNQETHLNPPQTCSPNRKMVHFSPTKTYQKKNPTGNLGPLPRVRRKTEVWTNASWARVSKRVPKPMSPSHCVLGILGGHGGKEVGGWERFSGRNSRLDVSKVSEVVMKRTSIDLHIPHGISSIKSLSAPTVYRQCPRDTNICFKYWCL